MKNPVFACVLVLVAMGLIVPASAQKVLVDFGDDGAFRSASVGSPDINGNYWNGIGATNMVSALVDKANTPTALSLFMTSEYGVDSYNGPAGSTQTNTIPSDVLNTTFNQELLGDLGATNAVFDFFSDTVASNGMSSNLTFTVAGLDPSKFYELTFFGSRKYPSAGSPGNDIDECSVRYAATGGNGVLSADLQIGIFDVHNPSVLARLVMTADAGNEISVVVSGVTTNTRVALNSMSIEALDAPPAELGSQTMLIDFNAPPAYRSLAVSSPDQNGNVWNGVAYQPVGNIVDKNNRLTTLDLEITSAFGSDSYNGPAGATSAATLETDVLNTEFDAAALGDLGATNAVFDYFAGIITFELRNLDPSKGYDLTFFGSHKYSADTSTRYSVTDSNGVVLASADLTVGIDDEHNMDTVASIAAVIPDAANTIYVKFAGAGGGSGYINALKIKTVVVSSGYGAWATDHELVEGQYGDDDSDGLVNLYEYGQGGDPTNGFVDANLPVISNVGGGVLEYIYAQRSDDDFLGYYLELTDDLVFEDWTNSGYSATGTNITLGSFDYVTNQIPTADPKKFIRMIIEEL